MLSSSGEANRAGGHFRRLRQTGAGVLLVLATIIASGSGAAQEVLPPGVGRHTDGPHWVGVNSCAATACHGDRAGRVGGEYTTWINQDPHARAYSVLFDERSLRIAQNLTRPDKKSTVPPHQDATCLACHAPAGDVHQAEVYLGDGVGCEACHGAAGGWLGPHSRAGWRSLSAAGKRKRGMIDTGDVLTRARQCVACHVGGEGLDVNHDLIAAGHPRLDFEYTAYFKAMPRHWNVPADATDAAEGTARDWLVGQAVTSAAAMNLLAQRAGDERNWPELAEYDCFSCHHDLASPSWRQLRGYPGRPGELSWGDWYLSLPRTLAAAGEGEALPHLRQLTPAFLRDPSGFDNLRQQMAAPNPDRAAVSGQARAAAAELAAWSVELNDPRLASREFSQTLLQHVSRDPLNLSQRSWDASAQLYLALVALARATHTPRDAQSPGGRDDNVESLLTELCNELSYPAVADDSQTRYESPRDYHPERFRAILMKLQQALSEP